MNNSFGSDNPSRAVKNSAVLLGEKVALSAEDIVGNEELWQSLRSELVSSKVITGMAVQEITRKFMLQHNKRSSAKTLTTNSRKNDEPIVELSTICTTPTQKLATAEASSGRSWSSTFRPLDGIRAYNNDNGLMSKSTLRNVLKYRRISYRKTAVEDLKVELTKEMNDGGASLSTKGEWITRVLELAIGESSDRDHLPPPSTNVAKPFPATQQVDRTFCVAQTA